MFLSRPIEINTFSSEKRRPLQIGLLIFLWEKDTFRKKTGNRSGFRRKKLQQQRQTLEIVEDCAWKSSKISMFFSFFLFFLPSFFHFSFMFQLFIFHVFFLFSFSFFLFCVFLPFFFFFLSIRYSNFSFLLFFIFPFHLLSFFFFFPVVRADAKTSKKIVEKFFL